MRYAEEWRQIRLSNQSPPKLQWCSARVQNAYMPPALGDEEFRKYFINTQKRQRKVTSSATDKKGMN
ncbi:hypothetical protein AVEN_36405-1, partial [Araneus ventricosus]